MTVKPGDGVFLVTGATGLVGSHVVDRALAEGWRVRALVRPDSSISRLKQAGVELTRGDFEDVRSLEEAVQQAAVIVHCAAKVGDWGPVDGYRRVNVVGLSDLLEAARKTGCLKRFVDISSLGVYPARDHHGTDERTEPAERSIDAYTQTKVEAEKLVLDSIRQHNLPAVVLRPGFIYGPRDRTVLPRILEKLRSGAFAYLGSRDKLMNNTYVGNLVDAIFLAIHRELPEHRVFNITDGRLVSKQEFIGTVARLAGCPEPTKVVPLAVAKPLATVLESLWKLLGKQEAPILSQARLKFLAYNLDYCIDRAKHELGYQPAVDFQEAMATTMEWFKQQDASR